MTEVRDAAVHFEAVKTSMSQSKQGTVLRLALPPNEVPPRLHTDWVGSRYMGAMVKLDEEDQPEMSDQQRETNRLIASAGMLCRNLDFAKFLFDADTLLGVPNDEAEREKRVAGALREALGVESRSEMRTNSVARERFKNMVEEFTKWKQM